MTDGSDAPPADTAPEKLPPAPECWDLWCDDAHSPYMNMALDEALLLTAATRPRALLRFYEWDRLSVSIGYVQRFDAAPAGFSVVRRPTGGGVVYHDYDLTYTVVLPPGHWLAGLNRLKSYDWINKGVLAGLARADITANLATEDIPKGVDRAAMVCFRQPTRYDILAGESKIAGSAQRRTKTGLLHQGSIHFGGPLPVPRAVLRKRIQAGMTEVLALSFEPFSPPDSVHTLANELVEERYGQDEWNRRR